MKPKETAKRIIALLLALIMAALCCACSGGGNTPTGDGNNEEEEVTKANNKDKDKGKDKDKDKPTKPQFGDSSNNVENPDMPASSKIAVKLEKCTSTGEVGFDKIDFSSDIIYYLTGKEDAIFPFKYNGRCGFIDENGNIVIDDKYDKVGIFSEGKAFVHNNGFPGFWTIIDKDGKELFTTLNEMESYTIKAGQYAIKEDVSQPYYKDGHAIAANAQYYDASGSVSNVINMEDIKLRCNIVVIDDKFNQISYHENDLFSTNPNWTFSLNEVPSIINNDLFIGYVARCQYFTESGYGYISRICDINGNVIREDSEDFYLRGGKYIINGDGGEYSIIDFTTDKKIVDNTYEDVGEYSDGVIPVCNYDRWGLIDTEGNVLIKNRYKYLSKFSHGLGFALTDEGTGLLINKEGEVIAELPDEAVNGEYGIDIDNSFTDSGFILVKNKCKGTYKGYLINEKGEVIFSGDFEKFKYISANYVVYGDDLYRVVVE